MQSSFQQTRSHQFLIEDRKTLTIGIMLHPTTGHWQLYAVLNPLNPCLLAATLYEEQAQSLLFWVLAFAQGQLHLSSEHLPERLKTALWDHLGDQKWLFPPQVVPDWLHQSSTESLFSVQEGAQ